MNEGENHFSLIYIYIYVIVSFFKRFWVKNTSHNSSTLNTATYSEIDSFFCSQWFGKRSRKHSITRSGGRRWGCSGGQRRGCSLWWRGWGGCSLWVRGSWRGSNLRGFLSCWNLVVFGFGNVVLEIRDVGLIGHYDAQQLEWKEGRKCFI